ncbi:mucin-3B-like [Chrysoperla carnea]|uniref:mucin-3B-like n=1 Tax=Chrysoperla carnea TaxID=189513 RepID=UPI001D085B42|nr:mucin-3B-like [Chrysoperla carnea]
MGHSTLQTQTLTTAQQTTTNTTYSPTNANTLMPNTETSHQHPHNTQLHTQNITQEIYPTQHSTSTTTLTHATSAHSPNQTQNNTQETNSSQHNIITYTSTALIHAPPPLYRNETHNTPPIARLTSLTQDQISRPSDVSNKTQNTSQETQHSITLLTTTPIHVPPPINQNLTQNTSPIVRLTRLTHGQIAHYSKPTENVPIAHRTRKRAQHNTTPHTSPKRRGR